MKKVLSIVIVCIMLLSLLPSALAEKAEVSPQKETYLEFIRDSLSYLKKGGYSNMQAEMPDHTRDSYAAKNYYGTAPTQAEKEELYAFMDGLYDVVKSEQIDSDKSYEEIQSLYYDKQLYPNIPRPQYTAMAGILCDTKHTINFILWGDYFFFNDPTEFCGKVAHPEKITEYFYQHTKSLPQTTEEPLSAFPKETVKNIDLKRGTKDGEPYTVLESLTCTMTMDASYKDTPLADIATAGTKMDVKLEQINFDKGKYYFILSLSGNKATKQYWHPITGMSFASDNLIRFSTGSYYDAAKESFMRDIEDHIPVVTISCGGTSNGDEVKSIYFQMRDPEDPVRKDLPKLVGENVEYHFYGDLTKNLHKRNLMTLFGLKDPDEGKEIQPTKEPQEKPTKEPQDKPTKEPDKPKPIAPEKAANELHRLGLFRGKNSGFALEDSLTREESVTMLVRLLGEEGALDAQAFTPEFADVETGRWSYPYVMYCYKHGITKGRGNGRFSPTDTVTGEEFVTLLLRLLGYTDIEPENAYDKAIELGLLSEETVAKIQDAGEFLRGDMVRVVYQGLFTKTKGGKLLSEVLTEKGAITE